MTSGCRLWVALLSSGAIVALSACATKRLDLPSGAGAPMADAASAYETAIKECRGVRTLSATLGLSGKAGSTSLRGNVDAGFEAPDKIRLEGRHPLGRPVFILVATGPQATLYLPRANRVLRNVAAAEIVEALVGLPLGPAELRALVSGCGFGAADPAGGRSYAEGWAAVDTAGAITYLRQQEGRWRVAAAAKPPLSIVYGDFLSGRASTLRLQSTGKPPANLSVRLSDVNINVTLGSDVFAVEVPPGAGPLTLDELRRSGPLGGQ
jgi:outer membrane lipoprotein-sorting protein